MRFLIDNGEFVYLILLKYIYLPLKKSRGRREGGLVESTFSIDRTFMTQNQLDRQLFEKVDDGLIIMNRVLHVGIQASISSTTITNSEHVESGLYVLIKTKAFPYHQTIHRKTPAVELPLVYI